MLRTFDALIAERNVSRAAARLFLSQPAVSSLLKRLREAFDDPLFTRTAHGVEPTPRALALAPHVQVVLAGLSHLLTAGQDFEPAKSNRIFRIIGSEHMSHVVLPRLCTELAATGSGIRLFWDADANYSLLTERLQRGHADVGLLPRQLAPADLSSQELYRDDYVLVARPGRFDGPVSMADYCAAPHVFLGYGRSSLDDAIDQILGRAGHKRFAQVAVTSFAQVVDIVHHSDHVAVVPARIATRYAGLVTTLALPFELPQYGMHLCWSTHLDGDPGSRWLRAEVARFATDDGSGAPGWPSASVR